MTDTAVTIVRCEKCGRTGNLTLHNHRFWCAYCHGWALVTVESVENAIVNDESDTSTLVRRPPAWYPLQALRVPAGWTVVYNNGLYEIDPPGESVPETDRWLVFKEDMLQMWNERRNRLLDLGWYPEGITTTGEYGLVVYEGNFRGQLLHEFRGRNRVALVAEIERLLVEISQGEL